MTNSPFAPLRNLNLSSPMLSVHPVPMGQDALGAVCFSGHLAAETLAADMPRLHVPLPLLDGDATSEIWHGNAISADKRQGAIRYRCNGDVLFGTIELAEAVPPATTAPPLQQVAEAGYRQIFGLLDALDFPFVYRFWNYMADINGHSHGLERYRQFNLGRQDAFLACGRDVTGALPAACALGSTDGPLRIAFLAGRTPPRAIENPRQVNACAYPEDYGPRSPTFSRASLLQLAESEVLFISGTASIVGHRTRHPGDAVAQVRETLANLDAVIREANRTLARRKFDPARLVYRVYVRHAADMASIREEMKQLAGSEINATFLQADICRQDLLVEIEATAFSCEPDDPDR